ATTSTQRGNPSRSLRFTVKAEDPDKLDTVTYRLAEGAPAGATIDAKSGEFSWTPKTKGEFTVTVIATDDGLPARSSPQKVTISVTDPPPPPVAADPPKKKLDFDNAKFTFVTAIVDAGGRLEAWLTIRTTGQVLKLHEGDKVNIGSIEGKLEKIDSGLIEIATPEKRLVVFLGDNLLQNRPGGL
ncbi:MAG TPA: cadherin repeat domain-containing protein, partial [Pirellulaceae bacterium]|nr:cadherin repeat domain-containing protein [Pirellulaceae bacterium]